MVIGEIVALVFIFAFTSDFRVLVSESAENTIRNDYGDSSVAGVSATEGWDFAQKTVGFKPWLPNSWNKDFLSVCVTFYEQLNSLNSCIAWYFRFEWIITFESEHLTLHLALKHTQKIA